MPTHLIGHSPGRRWRSRPSRSRRLRTSSRSRKATTRTTAKTKTKTRLRRRTKKSKTARRKSPRGKSPSRRSVVAGVAVAARAAVAVPGARAAGAVAGVVGRISKALTTRRSTLAPWFSSWPISSVVQESADRFEACPNFLRIDNLKIRWGTCPFADRPAGSAAGMVAWSAAGR